MLLQILNVKGILMQLFPCKSNTLLFWFYVCLIKCHALNITCFLVLFQIFRVNNCVFFILYLFRIQTQQACNIVLKTYWTLPTGCKTMMSVYARGKWKILLQSQLSPYFKMPTGKRQLMRTLVIWSHLYQPLM